MSNRMRKFLQLLNLISKLQQRVSGLYKWVCQKHSTW